MEHTIDIKPIKLKEFTVKQSKFKCAAKLPMRSIILGPSGSGKTILLQNMILQIYRKCFNRIFIFSPSIHLDQTWEPVKDYIEKDLNILHSDKDPIYFDHYNPTDLTHIVETQTKITQHMKKKGHSKLFQILIVIDDFADDPKFSRYSNLLNALYIRGRHSCISTITSTQVFNALSPIIRKQATELYIYRLRNAKDLEAFIEEVSGIASKKEILEIYRKSIEEPYSFLYINLMATRRNDMFMIKFDKQITFNS